MDVDTRLKRVQMFILETLLRLVCGQPCGAGLYMKAKARFKSSGANNFSEMKKKGAHNCKSSKHREGKSNTTWDVVLR